MLMSKLSKIKKSFSRQAANTTKGTRFLPCGGKVVHGTTTSTWYDKSGEVHRPNGMPAMTSPNKIVYMEHGKLHNTNGPAVLIYVEGKLHRQGWWVDDYQMCTWEQFSENSGQPMEDILLRVLSGEWIMDVT